MEFFEQAHVSRTKKDKKEEALKKKLTQLLHAYKKGNNEEIHHVGQQDIKYDYDDIKSLSELSDLSSYQPIDSTQESVISNTSDAVNSNTEHVISSIDLSEDVLDKSLDTDNDFKSSITSENLSEIDSSTDGNSPILSEQFSNSEISIPSSLQSSGSASTFSDEGDDKFDPDGALASKIIEKLGKRLKTIKNNQYSPEVVAVTTKSYKDQKSPKIIKKEKKKPNLKKHISIPVDTDEVDSKSVNIDDKMIVDSTDQPHQINNDVDTSTNTFPYVVQSGTDKPYQSLDDIIGEYVHSTVKNLPSQKHHIVASPLDKYAILDEMISSEVAEDISSVVPEIDEDMELTFDSEILDHTEASESELINEDSQLDSENNLKVYSGRNNCILVMRHPVEFSLHGKVKIAALAGSVSIYGYTLENDSVDVFAPYFQFAHCIKTTGKQSARHHSTNKLIKSGLTAVEAEEIVTNLMVNDAVISLSYFNDQKISFIDSNFSTELFTRWNDNSTPDFLTKAADNLGCTFYLNQPKKHFVEKATWEEVVECGMNENSRGIICGGKGLGKSTFLRYYVNRLLSKGPIVVIDLDPGQAEFTVPGNISVSIVTPDRPLIGPNFTHLRQPDRMLNLGMINVMDNPFRYVSAVNDLIVYCKSQDSYNNLPWIVNTMGMCNDLGHKFITHIICQLKPTFLYQIDSKIPKKRFQFDLQPHMIKFQCRQYANDSLLATTDGPEDLDFEFIKSSIEEMQNGSNTSMAPKEMRYLNVLAYFSQLVDIHFGKSILEIVPYEVNISDLNIGVNVNIPQEYLTKVINGKILALCQLPATDKGKVFSLRDNALVCKGYGLIRSIDFAQGILYVLTPVPVEELSLLNTLVYVDWMPDLHGSEKELPNGTVIPYRVSHTVKKGTMMSSPRRRFNPLQLIKATRNA